MVKEMKQMQLQRTLGATLFWGEKATKCSEVYISCLFGHGTNLVAEDIV